MPKRAQFAPGFAELRGNISGRQNLEYPTNDNKAFDGPIDGKNYARNYRASVIVSQRARDGQFHYSIRTKSMNHLTTKSKMAMALLGGAGAIYAAILRTSAVLAGIQAQYAAIQELGEKRSFRKYVMDTLRSGLLANAATFTFAGPSTPVVIENPWEKSHEDVAGEPLPSSAILNKFFLQLVTSKLHEGTFNVDGMRFVGSCTQGDGNDHLNFNAMKTVQGRFNWGYKVGFDLMSPVVYIKQGTGAPLYLLDENGEYITGTDGINESIVGRSFTTTTEAPA